MTLLPDFVQRGQRPARKASDHNSMVEAVRGYRELGKSGGSSGYSEPPGTVLVKNIGPHIEQALTSMEIVGVTMDYGDDPHEFIHNFALEVERPSSIESGKFVVLTERIKPDESGIAFISGVFPAFVIIDDDFHRYCDTAKDDQYLRSYGGGRAEIIFKDTNYDPAVCILRMTGGFQQGRGKADADITQGANGNVSVWSSLSGTSIDTETNISCLAEMGDVSLGDWVHWSWKDNKWEITQAECGG